MDSEKKSSPAPRSLTSFWALFTEEEAPFREDNAQCRHCKNVIEYHKKSTTVQNHLRRCAPFRRIMSKVKATERPEWYRAPKRTRSDAGLPADGGQTTTVTDFFAKPSSQLTPVEQEEFNHKLTRHFIMANYSFRSVEHPSLHEALRVKMLSSMCAYLCDRSYVLR